MPTLVQRLRTFLQGPPPVPAGEVLVSDTRRSVTRGLPRVEYNPDELVHRKGAFRIYDEMRTDEQVKACLTLKKAAVVGPGWQVLPQDQRADAEVALADTLQAQLEGVEGTFADVLWNMLSALDYGYSASEIVLDDDFTLRAVKLRAPHDLEFQIDAHGNVLAIEQRQGATTVRLAPEKVIHFVHQPEWQNPYGTSDLRAAYRSFWHKQNWVQWWAIWGEKFADAPVVATHPVQVAASVVDDVLDQLDHLQARNSVAVPEGWTVDTLESKRDPKAVFEGALNHHDLAIAKALLVPDKLGIVGGEVDSGSYALSQTQLGAFFFVLDLLKHRLETAVQEQLVTPLAELYGPGVPLPQFTILPLTQEDKQAIGALWIAAVTGNTVMPGFQDENHFRNLLGWPELTEEEWQERKDEQADAAAELAAPKEDFAARGPLPTRVAAAPGVPTKFSRPLTFVERRADMREKRQTFEELTPRVATQLATGSEALVQHIRAQVRRSGLAQPTATAKDIMALTAPRGMLHALRQQLGLDLVGAYERGAKEARGEVKRARKS